MSEANALPIRSWLYVPGQRANMVSKSLGLEADALIYDLEDAVPPAAKAEARGVLTSLLASPPSPGSPLRWVRLNHPRHRELFAADLACALGLHVHGVVLPKVETVAQLESADAAMTAAEGRAGLEPGSTRLMFLLESPLGVVNAHPLAAALERTVAVSFGGEDFSREMGLPLERTDEARTLVYQRAAVATAAAAAGVQAVDVIWPGLDDLDGFAAEAAQARRLGFTGKAAIHPAQLPLVHAAFDPTPGEVAYAREVLAAYEEAVAGGTGAINHKGAFLEEPVIARARRVLALASRGQGR
jgi:citrate lyase subunit beta/citryl-CoA lyase